MSDIEYPYIPSGRAILYVPHENPFMVRAREIAKQYKSNLKHPAAAVVVKNQEIIGEGSIGNNPAHIKGCVRVTLDLPTGEGYELCEGCSEHYHSEPSAIRDAIANGNDTRGADLYLWGHWWCCGPCWEAMMEAGIKDVYLLEGSEKLFNKTSSDNIIGKQFLDVE